MRRAHSSQVMMGGMAIPNSTIWSFSLTMIILVVLVIGFGLADDLVSHTIGAEGMACTCRPDVTFIKAFTNDDGVVDDPTRDPDDNGKDPGYDKDVAKCEARITNSQTVIITITNGYPSYTCEFWTKISNTGSIPLLQLTPVITAPLELTVTEAETPSCGLLLPGTCEIESFTVHIEQSAEQGVSYQFEIEKSFREANKGTMGFWKNWDSHNTFSESQIESWLGVIDTSSAWLGPLTVEEMESVFNAGLGRRATRESRFLAQYLATRLNAMAGMMCSAGTYDVTSEDPNNYLGLTDPENASLQDIIQAIESKHGTSPTRKQFNITKDVCDALNNLEIENR